MGAVPHIFRGCAYMPVKLKGLLLRNGLTISKFAQEIKQAKDVPLSGTAMYQIINHSYFPRSTPEAEIRGQIRDRLLAHGIPEAEMADMWDHEADGGDPWRQRHPFGAHVGQASVKPAGFGLSRKPANRPQPDFEPMETQMLSPQAKRHFNLFRDPFVNDVNEPADIYMSDSQRYILEAMLQTARLSSITAIIAESGAGKSTIRKLLQHKISTECQNIRMIFPHTLDKSKLNTGSICTAIIKDIEPDTTVRSSLEGQARQVKEVLLRSARAGFKHVLMIEEAHDLSIQTLKYLKRFHEIETDDGFGKVLAIILVGQPELKIKLDVNRYPQAREFINRCEIATLDAMHNQVGAYLKHKFDRCNVNFDAIFEAAAVDAIRDRWTKVDPATRQVKTQLYPLIINNTATRAMNRAAELGLPVVPADLIKEL